jgi:5-(hydroxymethyl)furfural/furfural oxidase
VRKRPRPAYFRETFVHYLIIGGGSAGCVLAARLTEDPAVRVTLVEAGRDLTDATMAPHVRSRYPGRAYIDPDNIWPKLTAYFAGATVDPSRSARRYEQGRLLGGGSAVNAMVANRGAPSDYDEWVELGAPGWTWNEVLPYFRKLERDVDFPDSPFHGNSGPIPVRRISSSRMSPLAKAVIASLKAQGHPLKEDQNGKWEDGVFVGAVAVNDKGERTPTSIAYLTDAVRQRPNLRIVTQHLAERIVFDGRRATGAVIAPFSGGPGETISADRVVLSAGAIHSPALLMRSGVGAGAMLRDLGVDVVHDQPAVGSNLMEHTSTAVSTYLPPSMRMTDLNEHHDHAIFRFTSNIPDAPAGDMHAAFIGRSGWHSIGQRVGTLFVWLNKPYSRGRTSIQSTDPRAEPFVDFNMLSDERDLARMSQGFRVAAKALLHPAMNPAGPVFPTTYSARVAAVAAPGVVNTIQRGLFSGMLDLAGPARRWLIDTVVTLGMDLDLFMRDDKALGDFLRAGVGGVWHASGSLRMGAASDRAAVTNEIGKVHGLDNLYVCDASLMPSIPRANTNMPTIMMAEKIADAYKAT